MVQKHLPNEESEITEEFNKQDDTQTHHSLSLQSSNNQSNSSESEEEGQIKKQNMQSHLHYFPVKTGEPSRVKIHKETIFQETHDGRSKDRKRRQSKTKRRKYQHIQKAQHIFPKIGLRGATLAVLKQISP